jgi:hypothetical protein
MSFGSPVPDADIHRFDEDGNTAYDLWLTEDELASQISIEIGEAFNAVERAFWEAARDVRCTTKDYITWLRDIISECELSIQEAEKYLERMDDAQKKETEDTPPGRG